MPVPDLEFGKLVGAVEAFDERLQVLQTHLQREMRDGFERVEAAMQAHLTNHRELDRRLGSLERWRALLLGTVGALGLEGMTRWIGRLLLK